MKTTDILLYFQNLFWLILPVLAFNVIFIKYLPQAYQMDAFWENIPSWIGVPENLFRLPAFILPLILRFEISSPANKVDEVVKDQKLDGNEKSSRSRRANPEE